ncbi:MAG: hypothetical protein KUG73_15470 [Pseudomonadales bacterium]|nr:hypothetical protein [Pseudomonadales bacterium]
MLLNSFVKLSLLSVMLFILAACNDERFSIVQDENRLLKRELAEQRQAVNALSERVANIEGISPPSFLVSDITIDITERMFNPVINGGFLMEVKGSFLPEVVFLELEITTKAKGNEHEYSQNMIHRFMPGNSKENHVEFVHPLQLHKVKSSDVELTVRPLTWYQGHQVK